MKPLVLDGNLGERHRSLNSATNLTFHDNVPFDQIKYLKEESDVDCLYKIDCANKYKDLDYILQTLKCDDTLYATRALKCIWLFTDKHYEHIVNPLYLHDTLFPDMMTPIVNKFNAKILKHTRDYGRCEQFYTYYKERKSDRADKFLPLCSPEFIHNEIANPYYIVSTANLQYFCKKSPEAIQAFFTRFTNTDYTWDYINAVRCLYFSNGELYLDLLEKYFNRTGYCSRPHSFINLRGGISRTRPRMNRAFGSRPELGYRISKDILNNHKKRVLDNFELYEKILNRTILYKSFTEEEVKQIMLIIAPDNLENFWYKSDEFKKYLQVFKSNDRLFTFKCLFQSKFPSTELEMSEQFYTNEWYNYMSEEQRQVWALNHVQLNSELCGLKVYSWYKFCKFDVAFAEVNKIIITEKTAEERMSMLKIVVDTLGDSTEHAHVLISYFKERRMNEMPHMKDRFLRKLLRWGHIYKIEEKTWLLLKELFISLGLSEDEPHTSSALLQDATHFDFAYSIINDKPITDKLKSQFMKNFSCLCAVRDIVDVDCKDKLFEALYQLLEEKLNKTKPLSVGIDWFKIKQIVDQFISLFRVWGKSTTDYPHIVRLIRSLTLEWGINYHVTNFKKLFSTEELLTLDPNEDKFLTCLKSDVAILKRYMPKLDKTVESKKFRHKRLLKKIRIYFFNDIAGDWRSFFINILQESTSKVEQTTQANTIAALCLLLPPQQFHETITNYIPKEAKVDMLQVDMHLFSLQKHFAKFIYLRRPPVASVVLSFARGDYLQYALTSLVSISVQMSLNKFTSFIATLLDNPVSIQKHAIRFARKRLPIVQLNTLMEKLWETTKNFSIKEVVFDSCFQILSQQNAPEDINNWWCLVRKFIQEMKGDEYRSIYPFINNIRRTPEIIQPELCMESWYLMKRAPNKKSISDYRRSILDDITNIMENVNEDFLYEVITELLIDAFPDVSTTERLHNNDIWITLVSKYLLHSKDLDQQNLRIGKVLQNILYRTKTLWNKTMNGIYLVREMFEEFIHSLIVYSIEGVDRRDKRYISSKMPFTVILSSMTEQLTLKCRIHYVLKFAELYLDCVQNIDGNPITNDNKYEMSVSALTSQHFGVKLADMQNSLVETHSPFVHVFFTKFLGDYLRKFMSYYNDDFKLSLIEGLIVDPSKIHNVLTAIEVLPSFDLSDIFKGVIERIHALNNIEVELMLKMKYGENKRHKFF